MKIPSWRIQQRSTFTNWKLLAEFLQLSLEQQEQILKNSHFPLNLPLRLAQKIEKGTLNDPILKQFLPINAEIQKAPGFVLDPVGDTQFRAASKLLHKYKGRALLVTTSACAMHCRYCFRQNFPYETDVKDFKTELECIRNDPTLSEIILSGGDPLSLSNEKLKDLLDDLEQIPHLKRIRFHTRFPIAIPERIDQELLNILSSRRCSLWFVLHINHPREIDTDLLDKIALLKSIKVHVLNQAVLLKDINDNIETLTELCESLVNGGIMPYYLHQLDKVQGAAHFEVPESKGLELIQALQSRLPGYAVPKYVQEIAGQSSKTQIN